MTKLLFSPANHKIKSIWTKCFKSLASTTISRTVYKKHQLKIYQETFLKNLSLKAKLLSLSTFLVCISILLGAVSYWSLSRVIKNYSVITNTSYPNTTNMLQMFSNYRSMRIESLQLVSPAVSAESKKNSLKTLEEHFKSDKELYDKYMEIDFLPGEEPIFKEFRKSIDESIVSIKAAMKMHEENKIDPASIAELNELVYIKLGEAGVVARAASHKLRNFHYDQAELAKKHALEAATEATELTIGLILVLGVIGFGAAFVFSNSLTKTLKEISDALDDSSTQVSSAAGQIASSSEELSQAATEQAASLEETSASVEEMSSMITINSENATKASENSMGSHKQAVRGQKVVNEMVESMTQINDSNNKIMNQINNSNEQMSEIVKVIQEIETKTKVINDIVFQTKLLSFNASVEAARAGEQGKGFAVVAEEVGNLAQMSGNAAKEISDMLASSVHKVEGIVNETKSKVEVLITEGREKVRIGTKVAEECGEVLAEIVTNVAGVTTMASEISNASMEQSKGIQEITKAMGQLDQVTQTNSATSEEAASAAEELSAQADSLKNQVLTLVSVINGKAAPVTHAPVNKVPPKNNKVNNVIQMKKPTAKNTTPMTVAKKSPAMKKVVGGSGNNLPSYDHPGFEEV